MFCVRACMAAEGKASKTSMRACGVPAEFERLHHAKLLRFSNDASLEETGPSFAELIRSQTRVMTCD